MKFIGIGMKKLKVMLCLLGAFIIASGCDAKSTPQDESQLFAHNTIYKEAVNDEISNSRQNAITRTVKKCSPAVVGINVTEIREVQYRDPWDDFFGMDDPFFRHFGRPQSRTYSRKYPVKSLGSGFIISADGYIITNDHVAGKASKIVVTLTGGKKYDAELIGSDPRTDVALLKINGTNLPYVELGNSDDVIPGEWAIAMGNPFGLFDVNSKPTVTCGIVSNTGVSFVENNRVFRDMIQTDAAISSGNSGGPLLNSIGQVIGINTIIFSTAQTQQGSGSIGIGFSVPINRVKKVVDLLKKGKIDRNYYTGLKVQEIDDQTAKALGLNNKEGVVVVEIIRNSPAHKAGIEPGDIIKEINGLPIMREDDASIAVYDAINGQSLEVVIIRNDKEIKRTMTLESPPTR
jgi:serine protease Do